MLHRLALRVLPGLALAVTETNVRKQKRLIMLVAGLVAFGLYRSIKQVYPLVHPLAFLCLCGFLSALTALAAFRVGRQVGFEEIWKEDGIRRLGWIVGWIGFVYGFQLSLMVLALLKILVHYDFLRHPDGPGMMAMIIACTSVSRDAFEIGHVRWLQVSGRPVLTFPDGESLRNLFWEKPIQVLRWVFAGACFSAGIGGGLSALGYWGASPLSQFLAVTLTGGMIALWSYLVGVQQTEIFAAEWKALCYSDLFRFWWWPGLAFAATYYLVLSGVLTYVMRAGSLNSVTNAFVAGLVGGVMALYGYYLGYRRYQENRTRQIVPATLLRCPFVMEILTRNRGGRSSGSLTSSRIV